MDHKVAVPMEGELARALDEWRRHQPDIPNRAEAIRRMMKQVMGIVTGEGTEGDGEADAT